MKLRKPTKVILWIIGILVAFSLWYVGTYSMGVARGFEVNTPKEDKHLLIVTQQSTYKDSLTAGIVRSLYDQPLYIKVIDITTATSYQDEQRYDACILMHTWEVFRAPNMVHYFKENLSDEIPILVITTSGGGEELLDGTVDGISSASEMINVERDINRATTWAKYALGLLPMDLREDSGTFDKHQADNIKAAPE